MMDYFYSGFATDNDIYIKRSETLLGLSTADSHLVWDNPRSGNPDGNKNYYVWGPYIYRLMGHGIFIFRLVRKMILGMDIHLVMC